MPKRPDSDSDFFPPLKKPKTEDNMLSAQDTTQELKKENITNPLLREYLHLDTESGEKILALLKNTENVTRFLYDFGSTEKKFRVPAVMEFLLKLKPTLHNEPDYGASPLHACCVHGELENVKLLLQYGANVNTPSYYYLRDRTIKVTPLEETIISPELSLEKKLPVIKYLLSEGATPINKDILTYIQENKLTDIECLLKKYGQLEGDNEDNMDLDSGFNL